MKLIKKQYWCALAILVTTLAGCDDDKTECGFGECDAAASSDTVSNDSGDSTGGVVEEEDLSQSDVELILNPDNCTEAQLGYLTSAGSNAEVSTRAIKGKLTLEKPKQNDDGSLDFNDVQIFGAKGLEVQAIACDGSVIDAFLSTGALDKNNFVLYVPLHIDANVKVISSGGSVSSWTWEINVLDQTSSDAIYAYTVPDVVAGGENEAIVDVHIPINVAPELGSGSAPFAIVDTLNRAILEYAYTRAIWPDSWVLPDVTVAWSVNNMPVEGDVLAGEVGRSHYDVLNDRVYLLGNDATDADQFDGDIVVEQLISLYQQNADIGLRSDHFGSYAAIDVKKDPRNAYSYGFAKAMSVHLNSLLMESAGFSTNKFYRNSAGLNQVSSFSYDLEDNASASRKGYYDELSVARLVYDVLDGPRVFGQGLIADSVSDDGLTLAAYEVMNVYAQSATSVAYTTAFSFISALKRGSIEFEIADESVTKYFAELLPSIDADINDVSSEEGISPVSAGDSLVLADEKERFEELYPSYLDGEYAKVRPLIDLVSGISPGSFAVGGVDDAGVTELGQLYYHFGEFGGPTDRLIEDEVSKKVCSVADFGLINTLGNKRYVAFSVYDKDEFESTSKWVDTRPGVVLKVTFDAASSDVAGVQLTTAIMSGGELLQFGDAVRQGSLHIEGPLTPGGYTLEISTIANSGGPGVSGKACFDVLIADVDIEVVD